MKGDPDAARHGLPRAKSGVERPLKDRRARCLVHVSTTRFRDLGSRNVSFDVHRHVEHDVGGPAFV
jgi:hypothetical protein